MEQLSITTRINEHIGRLEGGSVFFPDSFLAYGSRPAVAKALERLHLKGGIQRIAQGIYYKPDLHPDLGKIPPLLDQVAQELAQRDGARILPTGYYALNKLGMSEQVPNTLIFLTDGSRKELRIGSGTLIFKEAAVRHFAPRQEVNRLLLQALRTLGKERIDEGILNRIHELTCDQPYQDLMADMQFAPEWIRKIIRKLYE